ncbi:hypothetical protein PR048_032335 [Dryococelus australis]|uniref:SET domain-containing protein n=1 Tax=Dryococelus australis TaxID=614101 RepID=A0ABQ9G347_9NEOP|nr:hypothetical protein PR048_032335 [Dryococelus australis]
MGRVQRRRKWKWRKRSIKEDGDSICIQLVQWLGEQKCILPSNIQWAYFSGTGRGLYTTMYLPEGSFLIRLPKHIMITIHTVMQSGIGSWFLNASEVESFSNQQILAAFLIWERHLGLDSRWAAYINSLPENYTTPLTMSKREKALLPKYIHDGVQEQEQTVLESYKLVITVIKKFSLCKHCGKLLLTDIFTFHSFLWAWNTVNTRAVYVKPTVSVVRLRGENTLALAPFLDLFNHSCYVNTRVEETDESYSLFSSDACPSNSQVFISYGPHANYKLYIEYGFVVSNNPHDVVPVTVEQIDKVMNSVHAVPSVTFSKARNKLIKNNRLNENLCFSNEGPSFTLQAYIFVREVRDFDKKVLQQKIFTCEFTNVEKEVINSVVIRLLCDKIAKYQQQLDIMLQPNQCSESFSVAKILVYNHLQLLEKVHRNIFV